MQYQCQVCKTVLPAIPEKCPVCGSPREKFLPLTAATSSPTVTPVYVNVLEKLHVSKESLSKIVNYKTEQLGADTYYFGPGQVLAYHKHPESDQIFLILSGSGEFFLDPGEETSIPALPGMMILAPKSVWHKLVNTGAGPLVASQFTRQPVTSVAR